MSDDTGYGADLHEGHRDLAQAIGLLEDALPRIENPIGVSLALFDMYTDLEDMAQAGACLIEAARRVSLGKQSELTYFLYSHLELFAQLNAEAQNVYERLSSIIARDEGDLGKNTLHLDQRKIYQYDLIPELLLAQHLMRARQVSEAEYHILLHDLCHYTTKAQTAPRTVLHILDQRELPHRDGVIEFLAHDSGVPFIDLALFRPEEDVMDLLHLEFIQVRAACAFGHIAGEPMVAVLNPYNLQLRDDVGLLVQRPTHYYLGSAKGYQRMLDAIRKHQRG